MVVGYTWFYLIAFPHARLCPSVLGYARVVYAQLWRNYLEVEGAWVMTERTGFLGCGALERIVSY